MSKVRMFMKGIKNQAVCFMKEEDGLGIVEIVLILVIIMALALIFREEITKIVSSALASFRSDVNKLGVN